MSLKRVSVIGGAGPQGKGLAYRFAKAGYPVTIGSRSSERAEEAAEQVRRRLGRDARITAGDNTNAVLGSDCVLLAVPYDGHQQLVKSLRDELAGRIVISCVNPLVFDKQGPSGFDVPEGSSAEQAQQIVPTARVVGAFHHLSAVSLWSDAETLHHEDVLVCGDDKEAKDMVIELAQSVTGRDGVDGGRLRLARQLEPLTAVLISINKRYKIRSGIRIAGLVERP